MKIELPVPYHATREESDEQFARVFTAIARERETEGRHNDAARLRQMVINAVGPEKVQQMEEKQVHELTAA